MFYRFNNVPADIHARQRLQRPIDRLPFTGVEDAQVGDINRVRHRLVEDGETLPGARIELEVTAVFPRA